MKHGLPTFWEAQKMSMQTRLESSLPFLELLAEEMSGMPEGLPGYMTTACCNQDRLLSDKVRQVAKAILVQWREVSLAQLREVAAHHPPTIDIDLEALGDLLPALIDGSIIFSRVVGDQSVLPRQIRLYRSLIESTFKPEAETFKPEAETLSKGCSRKGGHQCL